ncbi:hypothetical protein GNI_113840, partial [Gregarina niphandrodes]
MGEMKMSGEASIRHRVWWIIYMRASRIGSHPYLWALQCGQLLLVKAWHDRLALLQREAAAQKVLDSQVVDGRRRRRSIGHITRRQSPRSASPLVSSSAEFGKGATAEQRPRSGGGSRRPSSPSLFSSPPPSLLATPVLTTPLMATPLLVSPLLASPFSTATPLPVGGLRNGRDSRGTTVEVAEPSARADSSARRTTLNRSAPGANPRSPTLRSSDPRALRRRTSSSNPFDARTSAHARASLRSPSPRSPAAVALLDRTTLDRITLDRSALDRTTCGLTPGVTRSSLNQTATKSTDKKAIRRSSAAASVLRPTSYGSRSTADLAPPLGSPSPPRSLGSSGPGSPQGSSGLGLGSPPLGRSLGPPLGRPCASTPPRSSMASPYPHGAATATPRPRSQNATQLRPATDQGSSDRLKAARPYNNLGSATVGRGSATGGRSSAGQSSQRVSSQRISSQRVSSQRVSSQRVSSQRVSSQRVSSRRGSVTRSANYLSIHWAARLPSQDELWATTDYLGWGVLHYAALSGSAELLQAVAARPRRLRPPPSRHPPPLGSSSHPL